MNKLSVIDFFCGGGGFSEGFRQQGFEIVNGYDHWRPAVNTYNQNFGDGKGILQNILDFEGSTDLIEQLPDTDVILGSPPCVSFSSSNNSGKADKSLGVKLTEVFLRIVAVKKHHPKSQLKAWFMENVTNSTTYLAREYNFKDLNLTEWAKKNRLSPKKIAIKIEGNSAIINSAEYGSAQIRKRVITGEIIRQSKLVIPDKLYGIVGKDLIPFNNLSVIKRALPKPNSTNLSEIVTDPLYPQIKIPVTDLTDHFYDTGLYASEWRNSKTLKCNHPYMGKMSFPENEYKPSRTITATKIGTSREALIYKSEFNRIGNGEYRTPTVREAACIMGFPITYQFMGTEGTKWRLVGNAVCPSVSRAFGNLVKQELNIKTSSLVLIADVQPGIHNLNTFSEKEFNKPPKRKTGSRFRRHPFKDGNLTVTLSNYDIMSEDKCTGKWQTSVQYGSGEGFPSFSYIDNFYLQLEPIINKFEGGKKFIKTINNGFSSKIASKDILQKMYEEQISIGDFLEPTVLIEKVADIINTMTFEKKIFDFNEQTIFSKKVVPKKQILALYALNKICTIANR
ncbi:MAG: (cytosine-5-)-methyltransferase [Mucilaginibacter sp.]|nr:(cytosine-5-)-methyltransferase [Mucilaginibacter sp.]